MKEKVGNLELEIEAIIEIDGKEYKVVSVPGADDFKGFPPSWDFVKSKMLSWRPFFRGKMIDFNGQLIPALDDFLFNMDEEMYNLILDIYYTFKVNKPNIETNISVVITDQINEMERKMGRVFNEEEKTSY
ncbi:hypothetical protein, partial [Acidianus sp. RZ1]